MMKHYLHMTLVLGAAAWLATGCGSTPNTDAQAAVPIENDTLEARSITPVDTRNAHYYGECTYKDGSVMPVLVASEDPVNDAVVFVYYIDASGMQTVFSAPNNNGSVYWVEKDAGGTLNPDRAWEFGLSEDQNYYTGTVNEGTAFECSLSAGKDARTRSELEAMVNEDITEPVTVPQRISLAGTTWSACNKLGTGSTKNILTFDETGYTKRFTSYKNTTTCALSGLQVENITTYTYMLGDIVLASDGEEAYAFDRLTTKFEDIKGSGGYDGDVGEKFYTMVRLEGESKLKFAHYTDYYSGTDEGTSPQMRLENMDHEDYFFKQ